MKRKSVFILIVAVVGLVAVSRCDAQLIDGLCSSGQCSGTQQPFVQGGGFLGSIFGSQLRPGQEGREIVEGPLLARNDISGRREFISQVEIAKYSCCVRVIVQRADERRDFGSGVLTRYKGAPIILTNYHIIKGSKTATIRWATGETAAAITIGYHADWDVAILYVRDLPAGVRFAELRQVRIRAGEIVTAYGFGKGVVTRLARIVARVLRFATFAAGKTLDYFIFGTPNQQGDSGGPVFDAAGKLVGIQWGGEQSTVLRPGYSIGVVMPRVMTIMDELKVSSEAGWCDPPPAYRPRTPTPAVPATVPVVPVMTPMVPAPVVPVPIPVLVPVEPTSISVDMGGIEAALQAQAAAAASSAESVSKLSDSVALYVEAQTKIALAEEARREEAAQKVQAAAVVNTAMNAVGSAAEGWKDASAAGKGTVGKIMGAAGGVLANEAVAWTIGEWIAAAIIGLTGVGGIAAVGIRALIPWATRIGLKQTVKLLNSPNRTDADDLLEVASERIKTAPVPAPAPAKP